MKWTGMQEKDGKGGLGMPFRGLPTIVASHGKPLNLQLSGQSWPLKPVKFVRCDDKNHSPSGTQRPLVYLF